MQPLRRKLIGTAAGVAVSSLFMPTARASSRTLTLCSYGGVFERDYRRAVVEPFMRAHPDIAVNYYGMLTSAQMLGTLRAQRTAPQIDVCLFDIQAAKVATDEKLLAQLDVASVPALAELDQRALVPGVAGPAAMLEHLVLLYSPQKFARAPVSWRVLWDEANAGKIAIQRPPNTVGIAFTLLANFMAGVSDYEHSYERGIASVAQMAPNVLNWDPKPDPYAFIVNGSATLGVGWNARGERYAADTRGRIAPVLPQEGTIANMVMVAPVRNSPEPAAARRFIDYALGAAAQTAVATRMFYTPVNRQAAQRAAGSSKPNNVLPVDWLKVVQIRDRLSQEWRRQILLRR